MWTSQSFRSVIGTTAISTSTTYSWPWWLFSQCPHLKAGQRKHSTIHSIITLIQNTTFFRSNKSTYENPFIYFMYYSLCIHFKGANIPSSYQQPTILISLLKWLNVIEYCKMKNIDSCIASSYSDSRVSLFKPTGEMNECVIVIFVFVLALLVSATVNSMPTVPRCSCNYNTTLLQMFC